MLSKSTTLRFYKRKDIQEAILQQAANKEIGIRYEEQFGKRPDMLLYPREILNLALQKATSFHCSEELWENPLSLTSTSSKRELDELRIGWDLVLDIDCKFVEYSKIAADLIIRFLKYCGVTDLSVKFSGNKGFHIGLPFEAFPKQVGSTLTKNLFPEAPKKIAFYVKENIKRELGKRILQEEGGNIAVVKDKVALPVEEIVYQERDEYGSKIPGLNVEKFLAIDTLLLASRHLYRMPYSLHEKSGLVSLPLDPEKILEFEKEWARPEKVVVSPYLFLNRQVRGESARNLLLQALDYEVKMVAEPKLRGREASSEEIMITSPISEEFFPPCMRKILNGLEDGRKRGAFCLMNYLGKIGWSKVQIEELLRKWNSEKNREPLREVYIKGQLNHFKVGERLPPNCDNEAYYKDMGVYCNADWCLKLKNPVNYTLSRWRKHLEMKEEQEGKGKRGRRKKGVAPGTAEQGKADANPMIKDD